jgi:glycosyltransferase involved in cell wall biosynthesis
MKKSLPRISIVTPSFNQAPYLEETIRSILDQNYENLEYVIIDGGSTDGSVDIIRKYSDRLAFWASERDGGQYHAINKGFVHCTGEIMGWLNADDKYLPWTFQVLAEIFSTFSEVDWISSLYPLWWDATGSAVQCRALPEFSREPFWSGEYLPGCGWHAVTWIQQESTFWRRSLWTKTGARLDTSYKLAADFELWARFYKEAELTGLPTPLGGFRYQREQRSHQQFEAYLEDARTAFASHGGRPPGKIESWWLGKIAKLIRFLEQQQQRRSAMFPPRNLSLHRGRAGGWALKRF